MLYSGCAVCGYSAACRDADDSEDMRLCLGCSDWLQSDERKRELLKKYLNFSLGYAIAAMAGAAESEKFPGIYVDL